jgi:hypothetical protein
MKVKEQNGMLELNRVIEMSKLCVVFPNDVKMFCKTIGDKIVCQHPKFKHIWTLVKESDIKNLKWN